jgi:hypothetical protein
MKRTAAIFAGFTALALVGCGDNTSTPAYTQGRAISQDIDATHVVGPTTTSPAFTQKATAPTLAPWRNEENLDLQRDQTGQLYR